MTEPKPGAGLAGHEDEEDRLWIPDNPDGSGWADVDWVSAARGSRYFYEHGPELEDAAETRAIYYKVVARLESDDIRPHHNTYYVSAAGLADFMSELVWSGGAEVIWHVEPCVEPPAEARAQP